MSVDIKFSLPPHVSNEMLGMMISRIVGAGVVYEGSGNPIMKASVDNPWSVSLKENYVEIDGETLFRKKEEHIKDSENILREMFGITEEIERTNVTSYWKINVKLDGENDGYCILGDHSSDHEKFQGRGRSMNPTSNLYWAAITTRLVQAFGGHLVYQDSLDSYAKNNSFTVKDEDALYPKMKKGETEEDRKFMFANALRDVDVVDHNLINMLKTKKGVSYYDRVDALLKFGLERKEQDLDDLMPKHKASETPKARKF